VAEPTLQGVREAAAPTPFTVTAMAQHILGQTKTYANCGRTLLGLEPGGIAF
jgi:hypothetical protein